MSNTLEVATLDKLGMGHFKYELKPHRGFVYTSLGLGKILGIPATKDLIQKHFEDFIIIKRTMRSYWQS